MIPQLPQSTVSKLFELIMAESLENTNATALSIRVYWVHQSTKTCTWFLLESPTLYNTPAINIKQSWAFDKKSTTVCKIVPSAKACPSLTPKSFAVNSCFALASHLKFILDHLPFFSNVKNVVKYFWSTIEKQFSSKGTNALIGVVVLNVTQGPSVHPPRDIH